MIDDRFYRSRGPFTIDEIANISRCHDVRHGSTESDLSIIQGIASLEDAGVGYLSVLHNAKYVQALKTTGASFCMIHPDHVQHAPQNLTLFIDPYPYRAYAAVATAFYPDVENTFVNQNEAIHPTAIIGQNCLLEQGVVIGPYAEIGNNTKIGAYTVVGPHVKIGNNCSIAPHVTLFYCVIGNDCILYPGVRVGQAGFGFHMDDKGHIKVPQLGRVLIQDDVEIGANTTVDRGSLDDTVIGRGSRIDNLVQIAHNVQLGRGCVIVAQVGIAGSTKLGDYVIAAGQAGISGHLKIGSKSRIAAQSGVMRDVNPGETIAGSPAVPIKQWHRQTICISNLTQKK